MAPLLPRDVLDLALRAAEDVAAALERPFDIDPHVADAARETLHPSAQTMLALGFTEEDVHQRAQQHAQEAARREASARARAAVADAKAHATGACRRLAAVVAATAPGLTPLVAELVAVVDESGRDLHYRPSRPAVWAFDPGPIRDAAADLRAAADPRRPRPARLEPSDCWRAALGEEDLALFDKLPLGEKNALKGAPALNAVWRQGSPDAARARYSDMADRANTAAGRAVMMSKTEGHPAGRYARLE